MERYWSNLDRQRPFYAIGSGRSIPIYLQINVKENHTWKN
jgi:hypothetical protein